MKTKAQPKVFCFGLMHSLSEVEAARCFGEHYQSVLDEPDNELSHINIRNFIKAGWKGVSINFSALQVK